MSCIPCTTTSPTVFSAQYFYNAQCTTSCGTGPSSCCDASDTIYNGPALTCSGINPLDTLETALQKLDEQVCSAIGDYSTYQFNCLETWCSCTITTEAEFVDQITAYTCETRSNLDTFIGVTFAAYQASYNNRFTEVEVPGITCATAAVTSASTLNEILLAYCTQFTNIKAAIDVSSVDWNQCFTVGSPPSTVIGGFDLLVDQICEIKATADAAAVLPVFNNTAYTCLATPGASDTLVATITKMLDVLCTTAVFDPGNITWGCTGTEPASLEAGVQQIVDSLDTLLEALPTYSADFVVTATDAGDPCAGLTISLATPIDQDRFVASNASDTSPGTLVDKLTAGTNITLDDTTTPGQVIINSTADTYTVKANTADAAAGFLDTKITGQPDITGSIEIVESYNAGTDTLDLTPLINEDVFMEYIFSTIENNVVWKSRFCSIVASCVPGDTCTAYDVSNAGGPGESMTYGYTDCDGIAQSGTLLEGESISVCALGGVLGTSGSISIVEIGLCSETTTTTTTVL